jgi:hypothetical protein
MRELPVITDIPSRVYREIGRAIVLHAFLEYILGRTVYDLLEINPKQGRIAVREPRGQEVYDMIKDLAHVRGIDLSTEYDVIRQAIEGAKTQRDQLGHGIWLRDPETKRLFLRVLRGTWQRDPKMKGKVKRRISPEGQEYGLPELRSLIEQIEATIDAINGLRADLLSKLKPSRTKGRSRS